MVRFPLVCPGCGSEHGIAVVASVEVLLTQRPALLLHTRLGEYEYGVASAARCERCGHSGLLLEFAPAEGGNRAEVSEVRPD